MPGCANLVRPKDADNIPGSGSDLRPDCGTKSWRQLVSSKITGSAVQYVLLKPGDYRCLGRFYVNGDFNPNTYSNGNDKVTYFLYYNENETGISRFLPESSSVENQVILEGIYLNNGSNNWVFHGLVFHGIGRTIDPNDSVENDAGWGSVFDNHSNGNKIINCIFQNTSTVGIRIRRCDSTIIDNCVFRNQAVPFSDYAAIYIQASNGEAAKFNSVTNNIIYNYSDGIQVGDPDGGLNAEGTLISGNRIFVDEVWSVPGDPFCRRRAQKNMPDLILCDIMMPDLDGYGVLHILSKDPGTANIPFIYLTAKSEPRDFRTGMNQGADDYITKPFDGVELFNAIEMRLKKNELIRTTFRNNVTDINEFFIKTKQLPGFSKISENRLSKTYKKKFFIYMEGALPLYLYFVSKGQVKTYKSNKDGKELITGLHNEGDFFGFLPLLENKPNNETAVVVKEAELFLIPQQDFLTMLYTNKEIARKFISMLSSNLYKTENQLIELAYQSVRHRVACTLLTLNTGKDNTPFIITVSRKDISNMVGTSTESLNRTLADFKEEGVIEISDKGLRVLDLNRLQLVGN